MAKKVLSAVILLMVLANGAILASDLFQKLPDVGAVIDATIWERFMKPIYSSQSQWVYSIVCDIIHWETYETKSVKGKLVMGVKNGKVEPLANTDLKADLPFPELLLRTNALVLSMQLSTNAETVPPIYLHNCRFGGVEEIIVLGKKLKTVKLYQKDLNKEEIEWYSPGIGLVKKRYFIKSKTSTSTIDIELVTYVS